MDLLCLCWHWTYSLFLLICDHKRLKIIKQFGLPQEYFLCFSNPLKAEKKKWRCLSECPNSLESSMDDLCWYKHSLHCAPQSQQLETFRTSKARDVVGQQSPQSLSRVSRSQSITPPANQPTVLPSKPQRSPQTDHRCWQPILNRQRFTAHNFV